MKREVLTALGLSDEVIEKIMAEHGKSVNSLKSKQTELEEQIATYKQHVSDRDKQLETLKKAAGDSEKLQAQISCKMRIRSQLMLMRPKSGKWALTT